MRVCNNLNTSICFNYKNIGITYCTLTNATNGTGWPKLSDEVFDGTKIDWNKFFDEREKEIKAIQNSCERSECKNCQQISEEEFIDDRKIHYVLLSPWQVCNSNCIYCLGHVDPISKNAPNYAQFHKDFVEPYDMLEIIKDMIKNTVLAENAEIDWAGGEPTLYPKFDEIMNFLLDSISHARNFLKRENGGFVTIISENYTIGKQKNQSESCLHACKHSAVYDRLNRNTDEASDQICLLKL